MPEPHVPTGARPARRARGAALALSAALVLPLALAAGSGSAAAAPGGHHDGRTAPHRHPHLNTHKYVALGDSYAAGIGIPDNVGMPAGCGRSNHNYASLTAKGIGFARFTDVTCGGAKTVDMTQPQTVTGGVNPAQLNAVTADTSVVTLQIGGNDIGFGEIIGTCASVSASDPFGDPCHKLYTAGGTDQLAGRIDATAAKVASVVRGIRWRAPHARILVLGYPAILPDSGVGCFPTVPVAMGDAPYLRDTQKRLNAMIAAQAGRNGARYVDVYGPSVGHDACQPTGRWVEGVNPSTPFHPNAVGHEGMAAAVAAALPPR
ncbi:SGNH/GDSL hydrolase family protein [Streptomyces sp. NPDC052225]|uniref:SGNH/GDSL hydrolase family protein n=1 Tax=Streptomyces sp. NPDC052225 TaxID=3154949 RepID=UPI00343C4122